MKRTALELLCILAVAGTVFFTNLGNARLWDRDEPRNSGCAAEMMERGDWVVPMFNDELRHQKPVLLYWLMMSAYSVFGVNEFSARFWSAFLAIGTVLFTYVIARRLFNSTVGMMSAIVLSTTLMFGVAGRAATPDSVLIFCSTLALMIYVLGTFAAKTSPDDPPRLREEKTWFPTSWSVVAAMYAVMGLGVLAKGLAGCVLPTAIIGMFLLIRRLPKMDEKLRKSHSRFAQLLLSVWRTFHPWHFLKTCWAMRPVTAVAAILVVAAPWYIMVGLQTEGDFLQEFLIGEHFGRATTAMENHRGNLLYYPAAILIGFFPWSIFAVPVAIGIDRHLVKRDNWSSGMVLMLCWVCVQVGIFSVAKTKLPSYITPCYPALAMLTGMFLYRLATSKSLVRSFWVNGSFASLIVAGLVTVGGMAFLAKEYLPGEYRLMYIAAVPIVGGVACLVLYWKQMARAAVTTMTVCSVLFAVAFFGFGTVFVDSHQSSHVVLEQVRDANPDVQLATYRCLESSFVFYAQRPIIELMSAEATSPSTRVESTRDRFWRDQPELPIEQFIEEHPGGMILTRSDNLAELRSRLPNEYQVVAQTPFFLKKDDLVLLSPTKVEMASQDTDSTTTKY